MSDASYQWCRKCRRAEPFCECDEDDDVGEAWPSPVTYMMARKKIPDDHPFFDVYPHRRRDQA